MSNGIISASLSAGRLYRSPGGPLVMGAGVYIHNMTAELAAQWIGVLEEITKETN